MKRCIHTSADFDYADNLVFSIIVVEQALDAIRSGASIVTDTQMAKAGINKKRLAQYGGEVYCLCLTRMWRRRLRRTARPARRHVWIRRQPCIRTESRDRGLIFAIGNAPTALVRLYELINEGKLKPELIIAAPVGFVNVVQSKELILTLSDIPYIVARGRKGGSNIAACICNSLLYML